MSKFYKLFFCPRLVLVLSCPYVVPASCASCKMRGARRASSLILLPFKLSRNNFPILPRVGYESSQKVFFFLITLSRSSGNHLSTGQVTYFDPQRAGPFPPWHRPYLFRLGVSRLYVTGRFRVHVVVRAEHDGVFSRRAPSLPTTGRVRVIDADDGPFSAVATVLSPPARSLYHHLARCVVATTRSSRPERDRVVGELDIVLVDVFASSRVCFAWWCWCGDDDDDDDFVDGAKVGGRFEDA
jgi:hypothetical protein